MVKIWVCKVCGHQWAARGEGKPKRCAKPGCRSALWQKGRPASVNEVKEKVYDWGN